MPRKLPLPDWLALDTGLGDDHAMLGLMQDIPLTTNWIFERGEQYFGDEDRRHPHGERHRAEHLRRARRRDAPDGRARSTRSASLPAAESARSRGTPRGTSALYFAIPGTGRVMHTLNIRYFPEQLDLHRRARRGRSGLRRPLAAAAVRQVPAQLRHGQARRS